MNRFALLMLYRSLTRHRLYTALNVGGLAVGIAVFLVLGLYVRFETSFEEWLPRHEGIYVVQTVWNLPGSPADGADSVTMGGLLDQVREDFPGTVGTRIRGGEEGGVVLREGVATAEDVAQVDASFFEVFDLPMATGDGAAAIARPGNVLVSETAARKYFGDTDPVGRVMTIAVEAPANYRVAGVFRDLPANTDLKFSVLIPLPRTAPSENWYHWGSTSLQTFLRFDAPGAARAFEQKMRSFVNRRGRELGPDPWQVQQLRLLPIDRMHLEPRGQQNASRKIITLTLGIVGSLTLLIAIVNYVNLATARAGLRAREVAMRKVLGARRGELVRQFLGEATLIVAVAALIGLILAELGLPLVNAAGDLSLTLPYAVVVPGLVALVLLVGIIAGSYPALVLSSFSAAGVLASARSPGGGRASTRAREMLVMFQFGLAIAFMIATTVLFAQTRHVRQSDLGFDRAGLLVVLSTRDSLVSAAQRRAIMAAIRRLPGVTHVAAGNDSVGGSGETNSDNVPLPGIAGAGPSLRWVIVGPGFFDAYGTRLLAGRVFDDAHPSDDALTRKENEPTSIVISRRAVAALGFRTPQEAVGRTVGGERPRTIIGVVEDMRFASPRTPRNATYYVQYREPERHGGSLVVSVRFSGDPRAMTAAIQSEWQRTAPQVPFNAETADRRLGKFYDDDDRATRLFGMGAGLAVLIGCVGLWGLASFNTARRVKEIGIRKTLGASSADIVRLLVVQFLRPVLIANLIAWPLAFFSMRTWLAGFDDRVSLSPLYFLLSSLLAIAIAVVTVLAQSLRASRAAPSWALRHD